MGPSPVPLPSCAPSRSTGSTPPFQFAFPAALLSGEGMGTSAISVIEGAIVCLCVCINVLGFGEALNKIGGPVDKKKGGGGVKDTEEHFRVVCKRKQ